MDRKGATPPRARDEDNVEAERVVTKVNRLLEILYIFYENADEDPEVRVSVKDEGKNGKKMKEVMLAKGKPIVLEKVRLYVHSISKGDLEVKKVESKSNQLAPPTTTMETAPAASKLAVVVEKKMSEGFKSH
ncbi:uncharacterized protein LOC111485008 [Cucurbita maxima]|uniref:Uncharacterized protein LOC111485008 n=1 Tax=Cucurbita maxima TaxID=3661 RepID=A0A6J1JIZ6_CUCMA|nr:uncharacterized protein LOC111485008 [Cucurbita maxima]